ncbi:MAG: PIN domain-containing protein [archaeon]|jgi:predicted nucleic acid-binding protein
MTLENFYYNQNSNNDFLDIQEQYLIDTNILVISQSKKESEERRLIAAAIVESGTIKKNAFVSIQNFVEFVNVIKQKLKSLDDNEIQETLIDFKSAFTVLFYSENTVSATVKLSSETKVHFFDALLAQTMLENNVRVIYTENTKDFNKIPGIKAINPFTDKKIARLCEKARKQKLKYSVQVKKKIKIK